MHSKRVAYTTACLCLILGILIYLLFRPQGSPLRNTFGIDFAQLRNVTPDWVVWWLPDGLWILAFSTTLLAAWDFKLNRPTLFWIGILLCTGIVLELLQISGAIAGTFDPVDLVFLTGGAFLPLALCRWAPAEYMATILKNLGHRSR